MFFFCLEFITISTPLLIIQKSILYDNYCKVYKNVRRVFTYNLQIVSKFTFTRYYIILYMVIFKCLRMGYIDPAGRNRVKSHTVFWTLVDQILTKEFQPICVGHEMKIKKLHSVEKICQNQLNVIAFNCTLRILYSVFKDNLWTQSKELFYFWCFITIFTWKK